MAAHAYPDPRRIGTEVSLARGLEAGGYYNLAKLMWALAYADEIRRSQIGGVAKGEPHLLRDLTSLRRELEASGAAAPTLAYLDRGLEAVGRKAELLWTESGEMAVCRACGHLLVGELIPDRCPGCGAWRLTFRVFPSVYFLEPLEPTRAVEALERTPGIIEGLLGGLTSEQTVAPPGPGEWSMREGLHHFQVTEVLLSGRVRQILQADHPRLAGVAAWAEQLEGDLTAGEIFDRFRRSRQATVQVLRGLTLEQWHRQGEHEEFGPVTLLQQASYFARHDHSHLGQLEAIREAVLA